MRVGYVLSSEAKDILRRNGLEERIAKAKKKRRIGEFETEPTLGDCYQDIKSLIDEKCYDSLPKENRLMFLRQMETFLRLFDVPFGSKPDRDLVWTLKESNNTLVEPVELFDVVLLSGIAALTVLPKTDLWDFKKYGFNSPAENAGVIGAAVFEASEQSREKTYEWTTRHSNGSVLRTHVYWDAHANLRIHQDNITPYQTIDPFGNVVRYNPIQRRAMQVHHSQEQHLMATVLKYLDETGQTDEFKARELPKLLRVKPVRNPINDLGSDLYFDYKMPFFSYLNPLARIKKGKSTRDLNPGLMMHDYIRDRNCIYRPSIAQNGDLVVVQPDANSNNITQEDITLRFNQQDAYEIIRCLVHALKNTSSSTVARDMLLMLNYRFSDEFRNDVK